MNPGGVGERSFALQVDGEKIDFKATLVSDQAHTVILWPNKKVTVVGGELRRAKDLDNLCVSFVDENGLMSGQKATVVSGARKIEVTSDKRLLSVTPGVFKSEDGSASLTIAPDFAYSFIYVKQGGKLKPYFLLNSDPSRPAAAGAG